MRRRFGVAVAAVAAGLALLVAGLTVPAQAAAESLFTGQTPAVAAENDSAAVTVGVKVTAKVAGRVTGVRFYKGPGNTGTHTAAVFAGDGRVSIRGSFVNETASGWQQWSPKTALRVEAGAPFVAAVHMPVGRYSVTQPYAWPVSSSSLTATAGVYKYGGSISFPTLVYKTSNYFVDVTFVPDVATTPSPTPSATATPSPSVTPTPSPTPSETPTPSESATPTPTPTPTVPAGDWPDETNTGTAGCPPLKQITSGGQIALKTDGETLENVEIMDETAIRVLAPNVTIRCVFMHGTGWQGIMNANQPQATNITVDRVDISCKRYVQRIGMLLHHAKVTRVNVHDCDHMINAAGDDLTIADSFCHDLTTGDVVHADCIQSLGGNKGLTITGNSFWSWGTSDVLLGQEYGEVIDAVIDRNRFMSDPDQSPPPAYLLYLTGTNTKVTNNRFTRRYTYGHCTFNGKSPYVWEGNVWDNDGSPVTGC